MSALSRWLRIVFPVLLGLSLVFFSMLAEQQKTREVAFSELIDAVKGGKVERLELAEQEVIATLKGKAPVPEQLIATRVPGLSPDPLVQLAAEQHIEYLGHVEKGHWWLSMLGWVLPFVLLSLLYQGMGRAMTKRGGPMSFGRSRLKIYDQSSKPRVTFEDVAGVDEAEAELVEVVDFLKTPKKYLDLGAHIPKGVLLLGPPGTGKTLLARAVAGEAGVPFFSLSGSDFVEMFVGVGAARVRDMFEQAKQRAPCIIFIDELDAIGKSRGGLSAMGSNEEREQTLNQLLVEMDGFDATLGVVIMAATNRPEILDPALVRAGRFDRQVLVDRPDVTGREAILHVHARKLKLAPDADLHVLAQRTPGMVGADLANLLNEAALRAARRGAQTVTSADMEEATDRIQLGLKKKNRVMDQEEKKRVAYHEAGHALVALGMHHADPVHRVTIIPRSIGALGATLQLPTQDRYLLTQAQLNDRLCVLLGGRSAETLLFQDVSTGAQNDLEEATNTARKMVCSYGMSSKLGPISYALPRGPRFLDAMNGANEERTVSNETALAIDQEVRALIEGAAARARALLEHKRNALTAMAERLLVVETLERAELEALAGTR